MSIKQGSTKSNSDITLSGKANLVRIFLLCKLQPKFNTFQSSNSHFYVNREVGFLSFLSFECQKQTLLFIISLIIFVFRAVPMRKQTKTELSSLIMSIFGAVSFT